MIDKLNMEYSLLTAKTLAMINKTFLHYFLKDDAFESFRKYTIFPLDFGIWFNSLIASSFLISFNSYLIYCLIWY